MAKARTIDVYANPYCGVDADGVPQGVVQMPDSRNWIGAFVDHVACERSGKTRFYFTGKKYPVPFTAEIAKAVRDGGLIVADKESALICSIAEKDFEEPLARLAKEKAIAQARLDAEGRGAKVADPPSAETKREEGEKPPTEVVLSGPKNDPRYVLKRDKREET